MNSPREGFYYYQAQELLRAGFSNFFTWWLQSPFNHETAIKIWENTELPLLTSIYNLPLELIFNVLLYLDWDALMSYSRTTKDNYQLCLNSSRLWLTLLQERGTNITSLTDENPSILREIYRDLLLHTSGKIKLISVQERVDNFNTLIKYEGNWTDVYSGASYFVLRNVRGQVTLITSTKVIQLPLPFITRLKWSGRNCLLFSEDGEAYIVRSGKSEVPGEEIVISYGETANCARVSLYRFLIAPVSDLFTGVKTLFIQDNKLYLLRENSAVEIDNPKNPKQINYFNNELLAIESTSGWYLWSFNLLQTSSKISGLITQVENQFIVTTTGNVYTVKNNKVNISNVLRIIPNFTVNTIQDFYYISLDNFLYHFDCVHFSSRLVMSHCLAASTRDNKEVLAIDNS